MKPNATHRPQWIQHRVNQVSGLNDLDAAYGAEIDIRSWEDRLVLAHDPWSKGDPLEKALDVYAQMHRDRLLILNVKEDGLERKILELLKERDLQNFFFLDVALPTLVSLVQREKERRVAVRVSEWEPVEMAERFAGLAEWVWLDCFQAIPPALETLRRLRKSFKVCLVSPELQGGTIERIDAFKPLALEADAICTKHPGRWQ